MRVRGTDKGGGGEEEWKQWSESSQDRTGLSRIGDGLLAGRLRSRGWLEHTRIDRAVQMTKRKSEKSAAAAAAAACLPACDVRTRSQRRPSPASAQQYHRDDTVFKRAKGGKGESRC